MVKKILKKCGRFKKIKKKFTVRSEKSNDLDLWISMVKWWSTVKPSELLRSNGEAQDHTPPPQILWFFIFYFFCCWATGMALGLAISHVTAVLFSGLGWRGLNVGIKLGPLFTKLKPNTNCTSWTTSLWLGPGLTVQGQTGRSQQARGPGQHTSHPHPYSYRGQLGLDELWTGRYLVWPAQLPSIFLGLGPDNLVWNYLKINLS